MERAEYNICLNRLSYWPDHRLSEDDYKKVKAIGMAWWSRGCFTCTWTPVVEDYLTKTLGLTILEDDSPDDLDAHVDRYRKHADNAGARVTSAAAAVDAITDGIPFGQPILVGHHSEGRARRDQKHIESGMRTVVAESEKAAYWQRRIAGAISNAMHKDAPGTIARRIKGLEADLRKWQRAGNEERTRQAQGWAFSQWKEKNNLPWELEWGQCTIDQQTDFQIWAAQCIIDLEAWAQRWIDHIEMRLAYERAYLAAVGGIPADSLVLEAGGAVYERGHWGLVLRVNKQTVEIRKQWYHGKLDKTKIRQSKSKAEIAALSDEDFTALLNLPVKWRTM